MRLYSRDDTAGQLSLQATLIQQVRKGHRFVTPLHRGSQTPLVEPSVSMEGYRKEYPEFQWSFFAFNNAQKDPLVQGMLTSTQKESIDVDSDSDDSSSSSSSSSSDSAKAPRAKQDAVMYETQWTFARCTRIQHVMLACDDTTQPMMQGVHFRAACGVRLPSNSCKFQSSVDPQLARCRHSGCFSRWDRCGGDLKKKTTTNILCLFFEPGFPSF